MFLFRDIYVFKKKIKFSFLKELLSSKKRI